MPQRGKRDWGQEHKDLIAALGQLEFMKLHLEENSQIAAQFSKEFEPLARKFIKRGYQQDDMREFRLGIGRQRWLQFTAACNIAEGKELEPAEVKRRASELWVNSIDAIIDYFLANDESREQAILTIWVNRKNKDDHTQ